MELEFVAPDLRRLDELSGELIVCSVWSDERPFTALAGLLDWRMGGRLSALVREKFVDGNVQETLLVPGRPRLPFEKVLVLGLGTRSAFGDGTYRAAIDRIVAAMTGFSVRKAVVELPGRSAIDPERAIQLLFERAMNNEDIDVWWLVENAAAEKVMRERAKEEHRLARQASMRQEA
jgi:Cytosol aminopeptidase family, N-terminal domain